MGHWADGPTKDLHGLLSIFRPDYHHLASFFDFLAIQKIIKKSPPRKIDFFGAILKIFCIFSTNFWPFWVHFGVPRREKVKIVILWKSCSRLGGSTIFKVQTLPKSTWNREKRHSQQKSMKKRSLGRLFGEKVDFWWFLGSQGGPQNCPKSTTPS